MKFIIIFINHPRCIYVYHLVTQKVDRTKTGPGVQLWQPKVDRARTKAIDNIARNRYVSILSMASCSFSLSCCVSEHAEKGYVHFFMRVMGSNMRLTNKRPGVIVNIVPPKSCPPGHYSLVNTVPPDIIH